MARRSVAYRVALRQLRSSTYVFAKDFDSGELFIGVGDARRVLGLKLRIPKVLQTLFLNELKVEGLVCFVDKKTLRLVK